MSKEGWKNMIWEKACHLEDETCSLLHKQPDQHYLLFDIIEKPYYIVWWIISDSEAKLMSDCKIMALMVCNTSLLKGRDYRLKISTHSERICNECDLGIVENTFHLVMQCPTHEDDRKPMYNELR